MADDLVTQAEQITLGAMMLDPAQIEPVTDILRSADFRDVRHGSIYAAITANYAGGAETSPVGVAITLNSVKELQRVGGAAYLHTCQAAVPTAANATWYARQVRDAAMARDAVAEAARLAQVAETGDPGKIEAEKARLVQAWTDGEPAGQLPGMPEVLTLRERLARPRPPVAWRIEGWQPVGARVILAAQYKAGKTTLTGNHVRSLVDGDPFLGRHTVVPITGTLALLDFEMSDSTLDDWLRDQGIVNDDRIVVFALRGAAASFNLLDPAVRAWWARTLRARGCTYVLWDCLRPVLDALGLNEHTEAGRILTAFDALLRDADIAEASVVHHMGHSAERSRGDSRLRDWPDVEWRLVRQDDDPASPRYISAYGRDVDVAESALSYERRTRRLTLAGGTRLDATTRAALGDVLALLAAEPRLSATAIEKKIMKDTDHPRAAVRAALGVGVREGWIITEPGPSRSVLHSHINPQCASAPQCATSAPANPCECASALVERRTAHTHTQPPSAPDGPALFDEPEEGKRS